MQDYKFLTRQHCTAPHHRPHRPPRSSPWIRDGSRRTTEELELLTTTEKSLCGSLKISGEVEEIPIVLKSMKKELNIFCLYIRNDISEILSQRIVFH